MNTTTQPAYRTVIGLEVHVQLLTRTKLFCGCGTAFGQPPNSATCPICTGLPGTLPVMNRRAFELSLKAALALNCEIAPFTKWDRKNYYYPDLPKNFQTSQYDLPFSHDGWLEIETGGEKKRIGIIRAHLEEDAGKMLHDEHGRGHDSLVDLNRAGTPLLEIVSQPELSTAEEAKAYLEEIRLLLREMEVSDCEMQEGSLRCDANVNVHVPHDGMVVATPIVEIKNLNSFRGVDRAIKYEAERQYNEFQRLVGTKWDLSEGKPGQKVRTVLDRASGKPISKATAGWDEARGKTDIQRRKEEASDYRYFPEPDLVPVTVSDEKREQVRAGLGEMPAAQRKRLPQQYGLTEYDAGVLSSQGRAFVRYFEDAVSLGGDAHEAKNWMTNEVLQTLHERKLAIQEFPIPAATLAALVQHVKKIGLNKQRAREVYAHMLEHGVDPQQATDALGFKPVADAGQLLEVVRRAIAANPKAVADYKNGKTKAADSIKGAVMRETRGQANTEMLQQLLLEELQKA